MYIYVRQRACEKIPGSFLEVYLVWDTKTLQLNLPKTPLERFEGRLVGPPWTYSVDDTWPNHEPGPVVHIRLTSSVAHKGPIRKTRDDILAHGTWCSFHDWSQQGGPVGPSKSTYFGIPVENFLDYTFLYTIRKIYDYAKQYWPDVDYYNEPRVVYHGTAQESVRSIVASGLVPSFGMLGTAVYFGTFWKAFRFATRTQDYTKRSGAILRYYTFWPKVSYKSPRDSPCECTKCKKLVAKRGIPKKEKDFNQVAVRFSDHEALWHTRHGFDAILAFPVQDGPIKNAEFAAPSDVYCLLDSIGHAESLTEHHEPFNRDVTIL
jgi:hypothetical protein